MYTITTLNFKHYNRLICLLISSKNENLFDNKVKVEKLSHTLVLLILFNYFILSFQPLHYFFFSIGFSFRDSEHNKKAI